MVPMAVRDQRPGSSLMRVPRKVDRLQHGERLTLLQSKPLALTEPCDCWWAWDITQLLRGSGEKWGSSWEKSQMCHQGEEQGTFPGLSVMGLVAPVTHTSVPPAHSEKSSLYPDRLRGRKLHCNKFRLGTACPGFNLRGAFKIRALRSGDKAALGQERRERAPSPGSSVAELAALCPGT